MRCSPNWIAEMGDAPPIDVAPAHWDTVRDILARHVPGHEVWAFGSRVTGGARSYSDLDLAVVTETPLTLRTLAGLTEAFAESNLPWRVDIVDWATTGESFRRIIEGVHVVVQRVGRP